MTSDQRRPVEQCEICIVGTGAGGGILAYRLAMSGLSVLSLEHGAPIDDSYFTNHLLPEQEEHFGISPDMPWPMKPTSAYFYANAQAHHLYATPEVSSTSRRSEEVFVNRQIFRLNGKTALWNAVALRQSARDFRGAQYGDSDVNWPLAYDDLAPHYAEVERLIGVCGTREELENLPDGEYYPPKPLRPADELVTKAVKKVPGAPIQAIPNRKAIETRPDRENRCQDCGDCVYGCRYGSVYKFSSHLLPKLAGRPNYRLRCYTKVLRLLRVTGSRNIRAAVCLDTRTRQEFLVEARVFVLCAGALETPRILFNSADDTFPNGLANSSGNVGCYLQDSIKLAVGAPLLRLIRNRTPYAVGFSDNLLIPRFLFANQGFRGGYQAQVCHFLPTRPYYADALASYPGWLRKRLARVLFRAYLALIFSGKAEVRRSNCVVPSCDRDVFGQPQVDVQYQYAPSDLVMQESMIHWGRRILRKCSGVFPFVFQEQVPGQGIHYAGTCRMAEQSEEGVVNANLQTFDHPNLYLGDASVFPDKSEKNLSLTIMALADRLADHLSREDRS